MRKLWRGLLLIFCTREAGQLEIAQFVDTTRGSSSGWPHGASQRMLLRDCRVWRDAFLCEELTHVGIRRSTHGASRMEEFQAQALEQVTRSCTGVLFNLSADTWLIGLCRDKAKLKSGRERVCWAVFADWLTVLRFEIRIASSSVAPPPRKCPT